MTRSRAAAGRRSRTSSLMTSRSTALPSPCVDQIGLEPGNHRQHIEQQQPDGIARIMEHASALLRL